MRNQLLGAVSLTALLAAGFIPGAHAQTRVSSIYGAYDSDCTQIDCTFGHPGYTVTGSGGNTYDNVALFFVNETLLPFLTPTVTLTGYQADNIGQTATITLPTIASHSVYELQWGSAVPVTGNTNLFAYDYDDEYGQQTTDPACVQPYALCSFVGNFDAKFSASLAGAPIASNFSPDNTQGGGNQQGAFVGYEGLNANGLSESTYDIHAGTQPGVLAFIFTGSTGNQGTGGTSVPEPATLALLGAGLGALGIVRRRRKAV